MKRKRNLKDIKESLQDFTIQSYWSCHILVMTSAQSLVESVLEFYEQNFNDVNISTIIERSIEANYSNGDNNSVEDFSQSDSMSEITRFVRMTNVSIKDHIYRMVKVK